MDLTPRQIDILNACLEIITEKDLDAVSIRNIATKVGVTEPAIYRHFKSKEDLILKLVKYFRKNWEEILKALRNPSLRGIQELEHMLTTCISYFSQNEVYPSFFTSLEKITSTPEGKQEIAAIISLVQDFIARPIRRGQEEGDIRRDLSPGQLVQVILDMMMSLLFFWKLGLDGFSLNGQWALSWQIIAVFFKPPA